MKYLLSLYIVSLQLLGVAEALSFGLISGGSDFFLSIEEGFTERCRQLGVTCTVKHSRDLENGGLLPQWCDETAQSFIEQGLDGVAAVPCKGKPIKLTEAGVPIVNVDSDDPESGRIAYIGTDNFFLGKTMAKLLRQLRPEGGTFTFIAPKTGQGRSEGFVEEITRYNDRDNFGHWEKIYDQTIEWLDTNSTNLRPYMDQMERYAERNVTAMIFMRQTPMRHENYTQFVAKHRFRNITFIGTDGADYQLDYLNRRYVDGLVGQLPYEMGSESAQALYDYVNGNLRSVNITTNVVAYNLIPVELPPVDEDQSLLGNLVYVGYVCFGIVAITALGCVAWTIVNYNNIVVKAAQPVFLTMIAFGVLVGASAIIPLSFDDDGAIDSTSQSFRVGICMSVPWLCFVGFTITFSALFSKTWRVNRLFHNKIRYARIQVSERDVLIPFGVLLLSNVLVLLLWTLLDPLEYTRQEDIGTDYWNRIISSHGVCRSDNALAYLIPLALLNFLVVSIAIWQAHQARNINSIFSEATYINLSVNSVFQAFLTGIPVVVVVRDTPEAFYLVLTFTIFLLSMAVLLLIFLPKIAKYREFADKSEQEQKRMLAWCIIGSSLKQDGSPPPSYSANAYMKAANDQRQMEGRGADVTPEQAAE